MGKNKKHIVSFSGGKDSTAMLLMMLEKKMPVDEVIFVDTTKEFPQMYRHIEKIKDIVPVKTERMDFDYWFSERVKTKGKNKGEKGYGWPAFKSRWCSALKREAVKKSTYPGSIIYVGIAFDEKERTLRNKNQNFHYPLVEWRITGKQALEYCYSKGFDWDGLYRIFSRVSCWCCPFSRIEELKALYKHFPSLWQKLKEMDRKTHRKFRLDYSVDELEQKFKNEC